MFSTSLPSVVLSAAIFFLAALGACAQGKSTLTAMQAAALCQEAEQLFNAGNDKYAAGDVAALD
ncbi:MAG TPA: hypothetical protein PLE92_10195, partial [Lentisphaeria bacterium]|nr:hypothetical protein [Lentisphaeria bacterium]